MYCTTRKEHFLCFILRTSLFFSSLLLNSPKYGCYPAQETNFILSLLPTFSYKGTLIVNYVSFSSSGQEQASQNQENNLNRERSLPFLNNHVNELLLILSGTCTTCVRKIFWGLAKSLDGQLEVGKRSEQITQHLCEWCRREELLLSITKTQTNIGQGRFVG